MLEMVLGRVHRALLAASTECNAHELTEDLISPIQTESSFAAGAKRRIRSMTGKFNYIN